jgi:hypothetical protein
MKSRKKTKKLIKSRVFKSGLLYKDLFFSVFNIQNIENKENAKYSTKNNTSESALFFLATKNHKSASTISISILRLIANIICIAWLPGSLFLPLKNM